MTIKKIIKKPTKHSVRKGFWWVLFLLPLLWTGSKDIDLHVNESTWALIDRVFDIVEQRWELVFSIWFFYMRRRFVGDNREKK